MSYLGTQRPIILYGTAFGTTWNLQTDDIALDSVYNFELAKDFLTAKSGYTWVYNRGGSAGKRRFYHTLKFSNLTTAQVEKLMTMTNYDQVQIRPHANSIGAEYVTCNIVKSTDPARNQLNITTNANYSWILELESTEYINHLTDTP